MISIRIKDKGTYNRDSAKFGGRDRGSSGHYGCEGALRCGCAGSGVDSRGEGAGLGFDNLLDLGLWRVISLLGLNLRRSLWRGLLWGSLLRRGLLRGGLLWRGLLRGGLLGRGLLGRSLLRSVGDSNNLERGSRFALRRRCGLGRRWGTASADGDSNSGRGHGSGDIVYGDSLGSPVLTILEKTKVAFLQNRSECQRQERRDGRSAHLDSTSKSRFAQGNECDNKSRSELHDFTIRAIDEGGK